MALLTITDSITLLNAAVQLGFTVVVGILSVLAAIAGPLLPFVHRAAVLEAEGAMRTGTDRQMSGDQPAS